MKKRMRWLYSFQNSCSMIYSFRIYLFISATLNVGGTRTREPKHAFYHSRRLIYKMTKFANQKHKGSFRAYIGHYRSYVNTSLTYMHVLYYFLTPVVQRLWVRRNYLRCPRSVIKSSVRLSVSVQVMFCPGSYIIYPACLYFTFVLLILKYHQFYAVASSACSV